MAEQQSNPQAVKFIQEFRGRIQQFVDGLNLLEQAMEHSRALKLDSQNRPTQADFDAVNQMGQQGGAIYASQYVPITEATWTAVMDAATNISSAWNGGQYATFLNAKP